MSTLKGRSLEWRETRRPDGLSSRRPAPVPIATAVASMALGHAVNTGRMLISPRNEQQETSGFQTYGVKSVAVHSLLRYGKFMGTTQTESSVKSHLAASKQKATPLRASHFCVDHTF